MTNETRWSYLVDASAAVAAISNGSSLASNAFTPSSDVSSLGSANHSFYPLADLYFTGSFSTSVSSASAILNVYRRDRAIDGTNHAPIPQSVTNSAYSAVAVGAFSVVPNSVGSVSMALFLPDVPLGDQFEFYLEDKTNASLLAGYVVKVRPKTFAPAP